MQIKFDTIELASTGRDGTSDFVLDGKRAVDPQEFIRAENAEPKGRGNAMRSVQFSVTQEHDTITDAAFHLFERENELPSEGSLVFRASEGSGGGAEITIANAVLVSHSAKQVGVSTFHRYSFVFGEINI